MAWIPSTRTSFYQVEGVLRVSREQGWSIFEGVGFPWLTAVIMVLLSSGLYLLADRWLYRKDF
ncbi:MAG: hypothetical protein M0Z31_04625 [Clostridia bacterium]|nr:hypothetical protein [Clostridia bacterium]